MSEAQVRRNIHTYPFKYAHVDPGHFFALEGGVIYIHIPFCRTKCHFCDYVVYVNTADDLRARYVAALCEEIRRFPENRAYPAFEIRSIYFGGGTPGLLSAEQLIEILETVRASFHVVDYCEIGIEFDPASVTRDKLCALRGAGFTRMSIGVQSFDETILAANNRPHVLTDVYQAWEHIGEAGFTHNNIDLIYPLIGLDMPTWEKSLAQAIALGPSCITAYPLEVWPQTAYHHWLFKAKTERLPAGRVEVDMCRLAFDMLEAAGYRRFSTSGYYHPDRADTYSTYLEYYWRTWPLIGFGVSSKTVIHDRLYTNVRSLNDYLDRMGAGQSLIDIATRLTKEQEMRRVMIRGLKMCMVPKREFQLRFGVPMERVFGAEIAELVERGLLVDDPESIELTREGQVLSSNAWETFFTPDDLRPPEAHEVQFGLSELVLS